MGNKFKRERSADEEMLKIILLKHGLDVRSVKLLTPLCDGNDQCVVSFYNAVKEDIETAREVIESEIGTVYDTVHLVDTHHHLIAFME